MIKHLLTLLLTLSVSAALAQDSTIVYFEFDKSNLSPASKRALDALLSKPNLYNAVVYGHTDQAGSNEYNDRLSLRRANAVKEYFTSKGLDAAKIRTVKGFGETMPAIDKTDAASRQVNRRVVVIASYEVFAKDSAVIDGSSSSQPTPPVNQPKKKLADEIKDSSTHTGDRLVLRNINFYGGRHIFLPESYSALNELLYAMQTIPTLEIEIQGHICCQPGNGDGEDIDTGEPFLSYNRAKAVYEYLEDRGIDKKRMRYAGFGHKFPLAAEERTEEERTANRRVEIKILRK